MQIVDVDFRFAVKEGTSTDAPVLQFRKCFVVNNWSTQWTEWTKVLTEVVPEKQTSILEVY